MATVLKERIGVDVQGSETLVYVSAKKDWKILFLAVWLAGWVTMPLHTVMEARRSLSQARTDDWFNILWSFGWLFGVVFVGWTILWSIGGREVLRVRALEMLLTRMLFGIPVRRKRSLTSEVRNLRYVPAFSRGRKYKESSICYEDSHRTVKFGAGLSDFEALAIIERMIAVHPFSKRDKALEYMDL